MILLAPTILLLTWSIWASLRWAREQPDALDHHFHTIPREDS